MQGLACIRLAQRLQSYPNKQQVVRRIWVAHRKKCMILYEIFANERGIQSLFADIVSNYLLGGTAVIAAARLLIDTNTDSSQRRLQILPLNLSNLYRTKCPAIVAKSLARRSTTFRFLSVGALRRWLQVLTKTSVGTDLTW